MFKSCDHAHGGHGIVRALAEHDRILNAEQDDQHHLDEDGARKPPASGGCFAAPAAAPLPPYNGP